MSVKQISLLTAFFALSVSSYIPANASTLTNNTFSDTKISFEWQFTWDGFGGANYEQAELKPDRTLKNDKGELQDDGEVQWDHLSATLTTDSSGKPFSLNLEGQHVSQPDPLDAPKGDPLKKFVIINNLNLKPQNKFLEAFTEPELHRHNPEDHKDIYKLIYQAQNDGSVKFQFTGRHVGIHVSTPETSSTLSLLALGTLGAASILKRKLKPSKSSEKETTTVS